MDDSELLLQLQAKTAEIRDTLASAKSQGMTMNEAQTELIVIDPLLKVLGYGLLEIHKRGHDAVANNFPDYTLLANTEHKWFLEVKRLDLVLKDGKAQQAVNYANNQGAKWAVLTNGRAWYFYYAHLQKPLPEKRLFQIDNLLEDPAALATFALLARASMVNDGLTGAWAEKRFAAWLRGGFAEPKSSLRKTVRKMVEKELQIEVSEAMFSRVVYSELGIVPKPIVIKPLAIPAAKVNPQPKSDSLAPKVSGTYSLAELVKTATLITGTTPTAVIVADAEEVKVKNWNGVTRVVIESIWRKHGLPTVPFHGVDGPQKWFLNTESVRADGKPMKQMTKIVVNGETLYADVHRNAYNTARSLVSFLQAAGVAPEEVNVKVSR